MYPDLQRNSKFTWGTQVRITGKCDVWCRCNQICVLVADDARSTLMECGRCTLWNHAACDGVEEPPEEEEGGDLDNTHVCRVCREKKSCTKSSGKKFSRGTYKKSPQFLKKAAAKALREAADAKASQELFDKWYTKHCKYSVQEPKIIKSFVK